MKRDFSKIKTSLLHDFPATRFSSVDRELWRQRPIFDFFLNKTSKESQILNPNNLTITAPITKLVRLLVDRI